MRAAGVGGGGGGPCWPRRRIVSAVVIIEVICRRPPIEADVKAAIFHIISILLSNDCRHLISAMANVV